MTTVPPATFHHEAVLHDGDEGFRRSVVPFVRDGLAAGETVVAVLTPPHIDLLRDALGGDADGLVLEDMVSVGSNPARIIPAWVDLLDEHLREGSGMRGVGEPVWPGRTDAELAECGIHEHLLNRVFDAGPAWSLLCPYDAAALDARQLSEVGCHHPVMTGEDGTGPSDAYDEDPAPWFARRLPDPPPSASHRRFGDADLVDVRLGFGEHPAVSRLDDRLADQLAVVVSELTSNVVRHGSGRGVFSWWQEDGAFVVEVRDGGRVEDPLAGRLRPGADPEDGRGLWVVNQLCDLVQLRTGSSGTTVRAHLRTR